MIEERPIQLAVAIEDGKSEFAGLAVEIVGVGDGVAAGGFKVGEHAVAHLGGGLEGEGDGENLLGCGDGLVGEQLEEALDEQAGLAGAGGGFDDEGAVDVEGPGASRGIGWSWSRQMRRGHGLRGFFDRSGLVKERKEGKDLRQSLPPRRRHRTRRLRCLRVCRGQARKEQGGRGGAARSTRRSGDTSWARRWRCRSGIRRRVR